jgi:hypothetical protein
VIEPERPRLSVDEAASIKETAGKLTDDKELQSEGKLDKAKGDTTPWVT